MLLYTLLLLVVIAVAFSGYTAFMALGLKGAVEEVRECLARIETSLEEDAGEGGGHRVSIARAREMPDALEAEMERRANPLSQQGAGAKKPTPLA